MTLAELGGADLSRSFLSQVERGQCRFSVRALLLIAQRLKVPIASFFADENESVSPPISLLLDQATEALVTSLTLKEQGKTNAAISHALRAVEITLTGDATVSS